MDQIDLQEQNELKKKQRSQSAERKQKEYPLNEEFQNNIVIVGVCCMEKKSRSKEMKEILQRINPDLFKLDIFDQKMIIDDPIESWPIVDCLMCFYSDGFPLSKAIAYADLRKPMLINDVKKQQILWDRKRVYTLLKENNIPLPKFYFGIRNTDRDIVEEYHNKEKQKKKKLFQPQSQIIEEEDNVENVIQFLSSDDTCSIKDVSVKDVSQKDAEVKNRTLRSSTTLRSYDPTSLSQVLDIKAIKKVTDIQEFDDYLLIDGQKLMKPFVEKPFDAEDHNIYIYYNTNEGGGCKKLFRKVGNQSSSFDPQQNSIRADGENYIYEEFVQTNGFDIKVYTVGEFFAHAEARKSPVLDGRVLRTQNGKEMRYPVCLTPEEKLMATKIVNVFGQNVCGFDLLRSNGKSYVCDVNGWSFVKGNPKYYQDCASILQNMILKQLRPKMLEQRTDLNYVKNIYKNSFRPTTSDIEAVNNNQELRSVVAIFRHGDRTPKQKMKMKTNNPLFLQFFDDVKDVTKEIKLKHPKDLIKLLDITRECIRQCQDDTIIKLMQMRSVLEKGGHFEGINRKVQLKCLQFDEKNKPTQVLIVLKWGGELTQLGEENAINLGQSFRNKMYPQDKDGLLRLHSTYRHDLKTFSSDEGRCQNTAAAFLKGFLGYEGEVTPILASMVIKNQTAQKLLDCSVDLAKYEAEAKESLSQMLQSEDNIIEQFKKRYPDVNISDDLYKVLQNFGSPRQMLIDLHDMIKKLTRNIRHYLNLKQKDYYIRPEDYKNDDDENLTLFYKRWYKLDYDFKQKDQYNISKIPDIYDSIKYDILHNYEKLKQFCEKPQEVLNLAESLCQFMVPFEYGISEKQKLVIGKQIVSPLCEKIKQDLLWWNIKENRFDEDYWKYRQNSEAEINSPWRHVRTRLYFTSASHMYSLFNVLYYGFGHYLIEDEEKQKQLEKIITLQYLSNIVIKLFEDLSASQYDINRFRLELSVSDGCKLLYPPHNNTDDLPISENIHINQSLRLDQLEEFLNNIIKLPTE